MRLEEERRERVPPLSANFLKTFTDTSAHAAGAFGLRPRVARAPPPTSLIVLHPRHDPRVRRNVVRVSRNPSRVESEHGVDAVDAFHSVVDVRRDDGFVPTSPRNPSFKRGSSRSVSDRMLRYRATFSSSFALTAPAPSASPLDRHKTWVWAPWEWIVLDGRPEEHRFVVGVRDHEQDVLPRARRIAAFATCETTRYTYIDQVCLRGERRGNANEVRREFTRGRSSNAPYALHCLRRTCTRTAAFKHAMPMNATSGVTPSHIAAASSFMVSCAASRTLCSWLLV